MWNFKNELCFLEFGCIEGDDSCPRSLLVGLGTETGLGLRKRVDFETLVGKIGLKKWMGARRSLV